MDGSGCRFETWKREAFVYAEKSMVEFELIDIIDGEYIYDYYPEGDRNDPGRFAITKDGRRHLIAAAKKRNESYYYFHAAGKVVPGEKSGISAWY